MLSEELTSQYITEEACNKEELFIDVFFILYGILCYITLHVNLESLHQQIKSV